MLYQSMKLRKNVTNSGLGFVSEMNVLLTCISLSANAACSWWRAYALGFLFTTTPVVLFLHAVF